MPCCACGCKNIVFLLFPISEFPIRIEGSANRGIDGIPQRPPMYPGVELRLLRYVVAVAEDLHFSRAAEKLHVAQPSVSKQIRDLENELGVRLFDRTKREVRVTRAGEAFVREAKEALLHSQLAVNVAKATSENDRFSLGYSPGIDIKLISITRSVSTSQFPTMKLSLKSAFTPEQVQLIRAGELDAGIVTLPVPERDIAIEVVFREALVVALPANHPLCRQKTLRLRELNDQPLITQPKRMHPYCVEQLSAVAVREGFRPKIVQEVTTSEEAIAMVSEGLGYTITRPCFRRFSCDGVEFRELEGQPLTVETGLAYRYGHRSAFVGAVVTALIPKKSAISVSSFRSKAAG